MNCQANIRGLVYRGWYIELGEEGNEVVEKLAELWGSLISIKITLSGYV